LWTMRMQKRRGSYKVNMKIATEYNVPSVSEVPRRGIWAELRYAILRG
jgi:hypothetical protein